MNAADAIKLKTGQMETIAATDPVRSAVERFLTVRVRCLVVCDGPRVVGVATMRDILRSIQGTKGDLDVPVANVMTTDVATVRPEAALQEVEHLIASRAINHVPVVDGEQLVGVLTLADVLRLHLDDQSQVSAELRRYIHGPFVS